MRMCVCRHDRLRSPSAAALGITYARIADDRYEQAIESDDDSFEYFWIYAMAASSGCGLLLSVVGSLAIVLLIKACKTSRVEEREESDGDDHEMGNLSSSKKEDNEGEAKNGEILLVEGESLIAFKQPLLETLSCSSMITLFVSVFFLNAAILCRKLFSSLCSVLGNVGMFTTRARTCTECTKLPVAYGQ